MEEEFINLPSGQVPRYNVLVEYRGDKREKSFREKYSNRGAALEAFEIYCEMGDFEKNLSRVAFIDKTAINNSIDKTW